MPAKDIFHNHVKNALIKDGWFITHDPLTLKYGIAIELEQAGILKKNIVLGFHEPDVRQHTGYAVA